MNRDCKHRAYRQPCTNTHTNLRTQKQTHIIINKYMWYGTHNTPHPHHTTPYHTVPHPHHTHTIPHHTIPHHTIPHHTHTTIPSIICFCCNLMSSALNLCTLPGAIGCVLLLPPVAPEALGVMVVVVVTVVVGGWV